jgi:serine/threonine protein kinase/Tol biopolymer transport system component
VEAERWHQIERLYHSALELEPGRRAAFLEQACAGDQALRDEVESLLASSEEDESYLAAPALQVVAKALAQDQIGRSLPGRMVTHYRILARLGSGGMGDVYKAEDTKLGRLVALKFLRGGPVGNPQMIERFSREARTASALNHPNICSIYSVDEFEGEPFITMELLEGQTLLDRIAAGPLNIDELLDFAIQIADGLDAAHSRGIMHRDLKPANLFITTGNWVKLLDFGLAKLLPGVRPAGAGGMESGLSNSGVPLGTVTYMSPEQARAEVLDARTDLFSFGAVLYEMATGRTAFEGATIAVIFHAILSRQPTPASQLRPDLPLQLEQIIDKALEKDRDLRYQHAADLRADLKRLKRERESGQSIPAHLPSVKPWTMRRRVAGALLAVASIAVIAGIAWKFRQHGPAPALPAEILPLNGLPGIASYPALRADGSQIAFSWDGYQHKGFHIYVQPAAPGAGEPLPLTSREASDISPVWSTDGTQIAFIRASQKSDESGVYVVPSSGGRERLLMPIQRERPEGLARHLAWCADGSLFVTDREAASGPFRIFRLLNGVRASVTEPPTGSLGDSDPACSPDGALLAFVRSGGSWSIKDVHVISLHPPAKTSRQLTDVHSGIAGLAWTRPSELIFASPHAGSSALWTADVQTSRIARVSGPVNALFPTAAAGMVAFSQVAEVSNIWAMDHLDRPSHGKAYQLIASTGHDAGPQLSPDGRTLVFASNRVGTFEIWIADADGRNPMRLTNFNKNPGAGSPRWSPDGNRIAFDRRINENTDIYVINRNGSGLARLTDSLAEDAVPTWSGDGREIYFTSNRGGDHQIWKLPALGGSAKQITQTGGFIGFEGPDGFFYYVRSRDTGSGIWRKPVEGGAESAVVPGFRPMLWSFWALQRSGIYFVDAVGPNGALVSTLNFQAFGGRPKLIAHLENLRRISYPGLAISATGDRILYSQIDHRAAEIMLMRPN